jgi:putative FmdB family regulatory protein
MPTYDYLCEACGHRFEEFQTMTAKVLRKCPACGKSKLERLIGAGAGVIFKGSGFYQTDYRPGSYAADAKADAKNDAKNDAKAESKPDTKGSCTPTCGTDQAPASCKMSKAKKKD